MSERVIQPEAVEAAAKVLRERFNGRKADQPWDSPDQQRIYVGDARAALVAAAAHMLREAWANGHESGFWNGRLSHGDPEALTGVEHEQASNPYRKRP